MTILRIISRGYDRETYQALREALDIDRKHPLGLIMHGASDTDGRLRVAQVWESQEYAECFDEEILIPLLKESGLSLEAEITVFDLHHLVTP